MISKSTLLHLRFPFSFFLLPLFCFALFNANEINGLNAFLVFIVWHLFIYPASNGYNSYFDKDEGSIALIKSPPQTSLQLYYISIVLDVIGISIALFVSLEFSIAVLVYGLISKMYSHPSIRLKKYPIISFIVVAFFQGGFVYIFSLTAISNQSIFILFNDDLILCAMICTCIIGASYPLTQIYQHEEDTRRGDQTLSIILGKKGSFYFSGILYLFATGMLAKFHTEADQINLFWIFLICSLPVFGYFIYWFALVLKDEGNANYQHSMRMTLLSGSFMLIYFCLIIFLK